MLRPYQEKALAALWNHIATKESNPCIVLPTGAGKTHMLAKIAEDIVSWGGRAVFVTHVRELIEQAAGHLQTYAPSVSFGIYSAGLKSRDTGCQITLAGIQSVYEKSDLFGHQDLVVIDEAHRIPADGEGTYRTFLAGLREINPKIRLVGLTATPYRTSSGLLCRSENLLHEIAFEVQIKELIRDKFLCPLKSKAGREKTDLSNVSVRAGEFVQTELEAAMMADEQKIALACLEIAEKTQDRKSVLVFCCGIAHAQAVAKILSEAGVTATIFGDTENDERSEVIREFRDGRIKFLVNVNVLTIGFDAPNIDCVAILRPTMSPGLWYQMCGRGFRIADGKIDCLVLDFGTNALRLGPVDAIRPKHSGKESSPSDSHRECPNCQEVVSRSCDVCPDCGYEFPPPEVANVRHGIKSDEGGVLSDDLEGEYAVTKVFYWSHKKKAAPDKPPTMWVNYECGLAEFNEWVCFEHSGYAREKAVSWWRRRSNEPIPKTVSDALAIINTKGILEPTKLRVKPDGKYLRIMNASDFVTRPPVPKEILEKIEKRAAEEELTSGESELEF